MDGIATNNAAKKKDLVRKNILKLLTNMSAIELKWLIRMIVKELKVGLSQTSVFNVYHPDAEEFYNVNNNLEKVYLTVSMFLCLSFFLSSLISQSLHCKFSIIACLCIFSLVFSVSYSFSLSLSLIVSITFLCFSDSILLLNYCSYE